MASDYYGLQYSTKECARDMKEPTTSSWARLRKLARFLINNPRVVQQYVWQGKVSVCLTKVDSDHAGCRRTRKSTSSVLVFLGKHCPRSHCSTQQTIALSSGESEFYAAIKGLTVLLGMVMMLKDFGVVLAAVLETDSTAALGMLKRRGSGQVRHLDTQFLWAQQVVQDGKAKLKKIDGESNAADLNTKHVGAEKFWRFMEEMGFVKKSGRSRLAKKTQGDG